MMPKFRPDILPVREIFKKSGFSGKTALVLSSWFGAGLLPVVPGTLGTVASVPLVLLLHVIGFWYQALAAVILIIVAIWASGKSRDLLGKDDPSVIVIDEVAGFVLTMCFLPISWISLASGFVMFRIFDIIKPYPVRDMERLAGGWGIVMDDVLAGIYAHLCVRVILFFR